MTERDTWGIELDTRNKVLEAVYDFVEKGISPFGLDDKTSYEILLAVGEGVENIKDHAYGKHGGRFEISQPVVIDGAVVVKIHDYGKRFNPDLIKKYKKSEKLEDVPFRGRGVYLMHMLMDEVNYEFNDGGNTLTLVKNLQASG